MVDTNLGTIACEQVVVAVGPWINAIWNMLELPKRISVRGRDGKLHDDVRMWRYMALQEGTLGVDPDFLKTNDGRMPPVLHVDTDAPLRSDRDGKQITDSLWGIPATRKASCIRYRTVRSRGLEHAGANE